MISRLLLPSAVRLATYCWVRLSLPMRTQQIMCKARGPRCRQQTRLAHDLLGAHGRQQTHPAVRRKTHRRGQESKREGCVA